MRSPFLVMMITVAPMMRGLVGVAAGGWRLAVCDRGGVVFLRFCASAAVPAQSEMTIRVISDLIAEPFLCISKNSVRAGCGRAVTSELPRQSHQLRCWDYQHLTYKLSHSIFLQPARDVHNAASPTTGMRRHHE